MQEQGKIKNEWIVEIFEKMTVGDQFRIAGPDERVQFVDAKERVFVRGVTMKEFVLHQTGELAKLGDVASKKIHPVHQPQRSADFTFS